MLSPEMLAHSCVWQRSLQQVRARLMARATCAHPPRCSTLSPVMGDDIDDEHAMRVRTCATQAFADDARYLLSSCETWCIFFEALRLHAPPDTTPASPLSTAPRAPSLSEPEDVLMYSLVPYDVLLWMKNCLLASVSLAQLTHTIRSVSGETERTVDASVSAACAPSSAYLLEKEKENHSLSVRGHGKNDACHTVPLSEAPSLCSLSDGIMWLSVHMALSRLAKAAAPRSSSPPSSVLSSPSSVSSSAGESEFLPDDVMVVLLEEWLEQDMLTLAPLLLTSGCTHSSLTNSSTTPNINGTLELWSAIYHSMRLIAQNLFDTCAGPSSTLCDRTDYSDGSQVYSGPEQHSPRLSLRHELIFALHFVKNKFSGVPCTEHSSLHVLCDVMHSSLLRMLLPTHADKVCQNLAMLAPPHAKLCRTLHAFAARLDQTSSHIVPASLSARKDDMDEAMVEEINKQLNMIGRDKFMR